MQNLRSTVNTISKDRLEIAIENAQDCRSKMPVHFYTKAISLINLGMSVSFHDDQNWNAWNDENSPQFFDKTKNGIHASVDFQLDMHQSREDAVITNQNQAI